MFRGFLGNLFSRGQLSVLSNLVFYSFVLTSGSYLPLMHVMKKRFLNMNSISVTLWLHLELGENWGKERKMLRKDSYIQAV